MEDVDDPIDKVRLPGLSRIEDGLLMTEDEFRNRPERGMKEQSAKLKSTQKTKTKPARQERAPEKTTEPAQQAKRPLQSTQAGANNAQTPRSDYCEPTSSTVKVEDLVTDAPEPSRSPLFTGPRRFWDRPTPPPEMDWHYDPRMPDEWNIMVNSMNAYKYGTYQESSPLEGEQYVQANPQDVSPAMEFTREWFPDMVHREQLMKMTPVRLNVPDESELSLLKLRNRFDPPRRKDAISVPYTEPGRIPAAEKGKGRALDSGGLKESDIPRLRQQWADEFHDMVQGTPNKLPPLREVNHEIHLIDESKRYTYHLPRCPTALRDEWHSKLNRYVDAGWWEPRSAAQAAPMMCIPKKDGRLRTVIDARQRNDNTIKDVTPLPDQEIIREDVARARYRSKIDLADAYEQVRVRPEDVHKTAFATISGTYVSHVVQQGDCNAPATFQRLMTSIFREQIGRHVHAYLDDTFIFSDTIEEHEVALRFVFEKLREHQLYVKWSKCELYSDRVDCLGHIIDDLGIHPSADKLERIREWRTPRNYNDIQRFVGLINYVSNFLPNITAYTGPLLAMTQNGAPFQWRPIHQKCFDMIKRICCKTPIIRPIDHKSTEDIWVICDASTTGVGAMYGQGPSWDKCRPAGFMSKKFTFAQQNYAVHELETLAILEALQKWEDKLIGRRIHIITDHKALEFFKTQANLSHRQRRWTDYMSRFDFDITYVKGDYNKVADCLSRYYESDTSADIHAAHDYVQADSRIDPHGEDLPAERFREITERVVEIRAMRATELRRSKRIAEQQEERVREAEIMNNVNVAEPLASSESIHSHAASSSSSRRTASTPMTLGEAIKATMPTHELPSTVENNEFINRIKAGYSKDRLFSLVLEEPQKYQSFSARNGIIYTKNTYGNEVPCIPRDRNLITEILTQAHDGVGHFGEQRTSEYVRRWYWWPRLVGDTKDFCKSCEACQRSKVPTTKPAGKQHSLPIPTKPWDSIGMDFVGPFPESKGYNYLWVIICRMTSMVHLIPVHTNMTSKDLSWIYLREIVRLHGLPSSIVCDRDPKFTSRWWRELHLLLGARLLMSTSFHPQTDGQTERANRSVGQILRTVIKPDQKDWIDRVHMTEFAINASVSETTRYAPFELNGGYMPSLLREIRSDTSVSRGVKEFAEQALLNLAEAHDAIIEARVLQTHRADKLRGNELPIQKGDLVYLSTKNLNLPKGRARKLCPKYIGPYRVFEAYPETSTYTLELPSALQDRRINPTFHASLLKPYIASCDASFPNRAQPTPYDFGAADEDEWFVDEILGHRWTADNKVEYEVRWSLGDTTWEPHINCNKLAALDRYFELQGVKRVGQLAKRA